MCILNIHKIHVYPYFARESFNYIPPKINRAITGLHSIPTLRDLVTGATPSPCRTPQMTAR